MSKWAVLNERRRLRYATDEIYREYQKVRAREHIRKKDNLEFPTRPRTDKCECCGKAETENKVLSYDHDHDTKKFRGWLCSKCNKAIGLLGDNTAGLEQALNYLKRL